MYTITAAVITVLIGTLGIILGGRINVLELGPIFAIACMGAFICHAIEKNRDE